MIVVTADPDASPLLPSTGRWGGAARCDQVRPATRLWRATHPRSLRAKEARVSAAQDTVSLRLITTRRGMDVVDRCRAGDVILFFRTVSVDGSFASAPVCQPSGQASV
jgi:hypothetical protein